MKHQRNEFPPLPRRFSHLPTPPCVGDLKIHFTEEGELTHPLFLWQARFDDRHMFVYLPEKGPRHRGRGKSVPQFRIDWSYRAESTYPNQQQFEQALFSAQNKVLDREIAEATQ